jgi:hypothetical protein
MKIALLLIPALLLSACGSEAVPLMPTATMTSTAVATRIPQTNQPTITPLPPTPTALPRFFTEEFEGVPPDWSILQSNSASETGTRIDDGALFFELGHPYQWTYAIIGTQEYSDVRIDVMVQSRGTSPEALGVLCRYSEANGWYEFNIGSDGTYSVLFGQWLDEGVAQYSPIAADASIYLKPGGEQNEVGLACQEDTLWLYLNGKLFRKLDVSRFGLTQGKLGLAAASFENIPVIGAFDWLKVSKP